MEIYFKLRILFFCLLAFFSCCSFSLPRESLLLYQTRLELPFGDMKSSTEFYIFTNWSSTESSKFDENLFNIYPKLADQSKIYFLDEFAEQNQEINHYLYSLVLLKKPNLEDFLIERKRLFKLSNTSKENQIEALAALYKSADLNPNSLIKIENI